MINKTYFVLGSSFEPLVGIAMVTGIQTISLKCTRIQCTGRFALKGM